MKMQIEPPKAEVLIFGCIMNPPFFFPLILSGWTT